MWHLNLHSAVPLPYFAHHCFDKTLTKTNLREEGFIWLTHPNCSPSQRKAKTGTPTGPDSSSTKERYLLACFEVHVQLPFLKQPKNNLSESGTARGELHSPSSIHNRCLTVMVTDHSDGGISSVGILVSQMVLIVSSRQKLTSMDIITLTIFLKPK